jgi:arylsulfatase A-like enzyme/Flp pilus assembly protein TadD
MSRARRRVAIALGLLAAALSGCDRFGAPPGVVLITIDTCRADRLSCYSPTAPPTPAIDRVAREGVLFENAAATVPLTLPSHCSILTGLYPDRHTVRDNGAGRLPDRAETLAEILHEEGWTTGAFLAAVPIERRYGTSQGFDRYDDEWIDSSGGGDLLNRLHREQRTADEVVDSCLPWIREALRGRRPFFAWVHFFDPHLPYQPPEPFAGTYGADSYEGEVAFVDAQIGRLLDGLAEARDRCVVVVTADHGESLGQHDESTHGFFLYEPTMRVPWVMSGPGIPDGVRVEEPVSLVQIMPTLLDHFGIPIPDGLDGVSTLDVVHGRTAEPQAIYAESLFPRLNFGWSGTRSLRKGRWKYVEAPKPELYDLVSDPGELHNIFEARSDVARELVAEMEDFVARGGALDAIELEIDERTRAQLDRLGYVGESGSAPIPADETWNFNAPNPKDMISVWQDLQVLPQLALSGKTEEAKALIESMLQRDAGSIQLLHRVLRLWIQAKDWESARETCRRILDAHPMDLRAWKTLGNLSAQEGDHAAAIEAFARAATLAPEDPDVAADLARSYGDAGRIDAALVEYDRALGLNPGSSFAVNGKALLLSHSGKPLEAVAVLREGVVHLPNDLETLNNLAWILTNESIDPHEGYGFAKRVAALAPDDPTVLDTLGWSAIRAGHPEEAIEPLKKSWEATRDAEVRAHLGVALAEVGRLGEGIPHVLAAVAERPALRKVPEVSKWSR